MPKEREIYAIETGSYAGEMWIYCGKEKKEPQYNFLSIPLMENRTIDCKTFDDGIESGIVNMVERVPRYVYKVSKKQYDKNEKSNN
jgi:hypothetical protein